ncbi:MAG TPA: glycosyltransferase family 9 protein [Verrucomicrobiae bacterium]|nr:glycosyltransferase family 9 protein [Verrucomicrobiae bacterium]
MSEQFRGKILVIRGGAIGDFILTLPAIAALRRQFPKAYLELLGYPHIAQLAMSGGLVDKVQSIEAGALSGFFAKNGILKEHLADYFSEFDLILSYLYDPDGIFKANVARCSAAQIIEGPHRARDSEKIHAAKVYLQPLERLAIFDADPVPRLSLARKSCAPSAAADCPSKALLALHPGSGSDQKNWPEAKWAELLEAIINSTAFDLLIVGGEAEGARLQRLAAALPPRRIRVAQSLPLPELASLLERASIFIGHDSGISHLAAALGLPGLLLWSETLEEVWRPPSGRMLTLRDPGGLAALPVERVLTALRELALATGIRHSDPR